LAAKMESNSSSVCYKKAGNVLASCNAKRHACYQQLYRSDRSAADRQPQTASDMLPEFKGHYVQLAARKPIVLVVYSIVP